MTMKEIEVIIRYIVLKSDFTSNMTDIVTSILWMAYDTYEDNPTWNTWEVLDDAIDSRFIFTVDVWNMMAYYQTPREANYPKAREMFTDDLAVLFQKVLKEMGKEVR